MARGAAPAARGASRARCAAPHLVLLDPLQLAYGRLLRVRLGHVHPLALDLWAERLECVCVCVCVWVSVCVCA